MSTPDVTSELFTRARDKAIAMLQAVMVRDDYKRANAIALDVAASDGQEGTFALACALIGGTLPPGSVNILGIGRANMADIESMTLVPIDEVPPLIRAIARLVGMISNRDVDTAWAIWQQMPDDDQIEALSAFLHVAQTALEDD
jgi:hypothetical protein